VFRRRFEILKTIGCRRLALLERQLPHVLIAIVPDLSAPAAVCLAIVENVIVAPRCDASDAPRCSTP